MDKSMSTADRWLLPDGIEEVLPPQARGVEQLRRHLLDDFDRWGYDFVIPPALEYLDSLLTGTASGLDLQTFKVTDQLSGRLMGLSADTTPQTARIDAHSWAQEGISRLCYCRTVFHAKAASILAGRTPTQIGAELYGEAGAGADIEIISLMLNTLQQAGLQDLHLDLGHVGIFKAFSAKAQLSNMAEEKLFELLKVKCASDLDAWAEEYLTDPSLTKAFKALVRLQGGIEVLDQVAEQLASVVPEVIAIIDHLKQVCQTIAMRYNVPMYFDFTDLRGYNYHTGLVFAAYVPGYGDAVAQGGRYNETGAVFGRARAATGFSADLKVLAQLGRFVTAKAETVKAPAPYGQKQEQELLDLIAELRAQGKRVEVQLSGELPVSGARIKLNDGQWKLIESN
jgi:ATP phosphoribosyltransferase regulatory subunit